MNLEQQREDQKQKALDHRQRILLIKTIKHGEQVYAALEQELAQAKETILRLEQVVAELKALNTTLEEKLIKSDVVSSSMLSLEIKIARMEKLMTESDQRTSTLAIKNALLEKQLGQAEGKFRYYRNKLSEAVTDLNKEKRISKEANDKAAARDAKQKFEINRLTQELARAREKQAAIVDQTPATPNRQFTISTELVTDRSSQSTTRTR